MYNKKMTLGIIISAFNTYNKINQGNIFLELLFFLKRQNMYFVSEIFIPYFKNNIPLASIFKDERRSIKILYYYTKDINEYLFVENTKSSD